jgi:hypothetical protein
METRDIALKAAEIISQHGLAKHILHSSIEGTYCHNGAILAAQLGEEFLVSPTGEYAAAWLEVHKISEASAQRLGLSTFDGPASMAAWNNEPERSAEDVILALKHAAELV